MSTYGKLTVPTADIFKSQNQIASLDENGKLKDSEIPMEAIKTSLSNSDLSVKSITVKSDDGSYSGKIFQNYAATEIASSEAGTGLNLYSYSYNNQKVAEIVLGATEGTIDGNIVLKSYGATNYNAGEINILSSDGNSIKLGDGQFKLSSINTETNAGSEINLTKDNIEIVGANTTTIANNVNGEQITIGSDGITLDSKNTSSISLKNATAISLSTQNAGSISMSNNTMNLTSDQITLRSIGSSGIVLNGYGDSRVSLTSDDVSFTHGNNGASLILSDKSTNSTPVRLTSAAPYGGPWLIFSSDRSIYLDSEEGVGGIHIKSTSLTTFQNNEFKFEPCTGVTDPVYIKVPVVNSSTNKLDGTYAKLYVSKNSSGTLELKVEAAS